MRNSDACDLAAGLRKLLDPHDDVLHRAAGAEDFGVIQRLRSVKADLVLDPGADDVMRDRTPAAAWSGPAGACACSMATHLVLAKPAGVFKFRRGRRQSRGSSASAWQPIISDIGNGQGCERKYFTRPQTDAGFFPGLAAHGVLEDFRPAR